MVSIVIIIIIIILASTGFYFSVATSPVSSWALSLSLYLSLCPSIVGGSDQLRIAQSV
jgi:hypothetical protein